MRRILLFTFLISLVLGALAQTYQGTPWTGTPWAFGTDDSLNFSVGNAYEHNKGPYDGIPGFLYDIGEVNTLLRSGQDPTGTLVAGADAEMSSGPKVDYRGPQATTDGITLTASDLAAAVSDNFGGAFTFHSGRRVPNKTGGWYRYTCSFAEGNYKLTMRAWGNTDPRCGFWFKVYDKNMNQIYPWTRFNGGDTNGGGVGFDEGFIEVPLDSVPYVNWISPRPNTKTKWFSSIDEFTLSGEVVIELCDPGPTLDYDRDAGGPGGNIGEIAFEYMGAPADKFAPVAGPFKSQYDEAETLSLKLNEAGTLYLVPAGTAEEDIETAYVDKMEMTTVDTYTKAAVDLIGDTIQIATKDAAGNMRLERGTVSARYMITADTNQGNNLDTIRVNVTRDGVAALLPPEVMPDFGSVLGAVAAGNADTANVTSGGNDLVIRNLTGDQNCNLYMFDISGDMVVVSSPVAFQLGAGGEPIGIHPHQADVKVYVSGNQIILKHNGEFEDLYIYDLLGKQRMHRNVKSTHMELDASDLIEGVYIIKLYGAKEGVISRKFMINTR